MEAAHSFRVFLKNYMNAQVKKNAKSKGDEHSPVQRPTSGTIYVAKTFPTWQSIVLTTMKTLHDVSKAWNRCE